jgi:SAM-dependent methyltransferase
MTEKEPYSRRFYEQQQEGSFRSAMRVLPHVFELVSPRSIVDVGCGVGTWLAAARELGVVDVCGVDGDHVDRAMLRIPAERFRPLDLTQPFRLDQTFDLALSLEVGEHLPESSAEGFVECLTRLAPAVLFSAAIPKQLGENHVNEQWQTWWIERFRQFSFVALDCIRRRIWDDCAVEWWYAQNTLLMLRVDYLQSSLRLREEWAKSSGPYAIVHPRAYLDRLAFAEEMSASGLRQWLAAGPAVAAASARRLLRRMTGARLP